MPAHYRWSPLLGAPPQPRETLLYFRGDVGSTRQPNYSRGIRQRLHALAQTPEWKEQYKIKIGSREEVPGDYSQGLASSKFCLVAPGAVGSNRCWLCMHLLLRAVSRLGLELLSPPLAQRNKAPK
jgi:hypothetical protein